MFELDLARHHRNAPGQVASRVGPAKGGLCLIAFEIVGSRPKKCDESAAKWE